MSISPKPKPTRPQRTQTNVRHIHISLPPRRPNSVLKISSHTSHSVGALGLKMSRTIWLALFCLIGLSPAIAIKVAGPPSPLVVEREQHQREIEPAFALNEPAKSDRLKLPNARAETEIIVPAANTVPADTMPAHAMPAETPTTSPETVKKVAERHWRNANAKLVPDATPRRHTKSKEPKQSAGKVPTNQRAEIWHCRQDAMGSLLRSLDLSPRCSL